MSIEELRDKAKREFVNNFINQANLSLILQILIKEAESQSHDYANNLSEKDLRELENSLSNSKTKSSKPSFGDKVSDLIKNIKLKLGIKPKRKGFSTKKIS